MNQDCEFYEINLLDKWLILIPMQSELLLTVEEGVEKLNDS